jgi:hypothetical protein
VLAGGEPLAEVLLAEQVEHGFHGESEPGRQRRLVERVAQHRQQAA